MEIIQVVRNIDWEMLREQKKDLVKIADEDIEYDVYGIVNLVDAIQDAAVKDGLATEKEVFGHFDTLEKYPEIKVKFPEDGTEEFSVEKLDIINRYFPFDRAIGLMTFDGDDIVNLTLYGPMTIEIDGKYDSRNDLMPTKIYFPRTGKSFMFNWHPFDSMGGLDQYEFERVIRSIYEQIT